MTERPSARKLGGKVRVGAADRPRRARRAVAAVPGRRAPRRARSGCRSAARRSACSACSGCRSARSGRTTCCSSTRRTAASPAWSASSATRPRRVDDRRARRDRLRDRRRHPLPARPAAPPRGAEARRRRASTSPAPTRTATSSCSCRPGFARYGEETVLYRAAEQAAARAVDGRRRPATAGSGRPSPLDARRAARGSTRPATPQPVQRLEALRLADWERQGANWRDPAQQPRPDPALRRRRGVRPGDRRRRQGRHAARRVRPDRRREGGPAALPEDPRPARRRRRPISRTSPSGAIAARTGQRLRPPIGSGRDRPGPNVRVADRSATRGSGLRYDRHRHAADEGNARPRRRAGTRAGRRPLTGGPAWDQTTARRESIDDLDALLGGAAAGDRRRRPRAPEQGGR